MLALVSPLEARVLSNQLLSLISRSSKANSRLTNTPQGIRNPVCGICTYVEEANALLDDVRRDAILLEEAQRFCLTVWLTAQINLVAHQD